VAPIAWAVLAGDAEAGVTLHHMVEDIDAGDVIAQRAVPIAPDDSAREVYDKVSAAAVALFRESYPFPPTLLATRLAQDPAAASYHRQGDLDFSRREIDWARPAPVVHRWIRALIFPPMQHPETHTGARRLAVTRVAGAIGAPVSAPPGTVVARTRDGIEVAAGDGRIRVLGLADPARPDLSAGALFEALPPGERLGAAAGV
jgi:methionyl-tRNA formyltransferase